VSDPRALPASRRFASVPSSVAAARAFVAEVLGDLPGELCADAALAVSELATNAIVHAGSDFEVRIERDGSRVTVRVADSGPGGPEVRSPQATEAHGRGLQIVRTMASAWGVEHSPQELGKAVWFTLEVAAR